MKRAYIMVAMLAGLIAPPALAQTTTPVLTVSAKLVDNSPGDGKIVLSKKRGPFAAKTAIRNEPCPVTTLTPAYSYVAFGAECPVPVVTPPPVEEPPVVTPPVEEPPVVTPPVTDPTPPPVTAPAGTTMILTAEGESFLQNDQIGVGLTDTASIGTVTNTSPKGIRTDVAHGYQRLGLFGRTGSDVILIDAAIGGGTMYVNGVGHTAMRLRGYYAQMPGKFVDPLNWQGAGSGVDVRIAFNLIGKELSQTVTFTNTTSKAVVVQYQWSADPDQKDANSTTQRVTVAGTVESTLGNGAGVYYLTSPEPGAYITRAGTYTFREIGNTMPVGTVRKADDVVQLVSAPTLLQPGASTTFRMAQGLR